MNRAISAGELFLVLVISVAAFVAVPAPCSAGQPGSRIALEAAIGAAVAPMSEWRDFWDDVSAYKDQEIAGFYEIGLRYHLNEANALVLSYERLTTEAWAPFMMYYGSPGDTTGYAFGEMDWDFEATPVSLSYEFYPRGSTADVRPYFGVGASYYFFTGVDASLVVLEDTLMPEVTQLAMRGGRGYGVHAYVGCRARLVGGVYVLARIRGRYADGMGFTDEEEDIPIHLNGYDAALGLGYEF